MRPLNRSQNVMERSQKIFPGGVNSPVRSFGAVGGTPIVFKGGQNQWLTDVDGNRYIDFCGSWGPLILGHGHPKVMAALNQQAKRAFTFGAPCEEELLLAEKVQQWVPGLDMLRFVSSGTEATMSAIRVARAATKRSGIVKFEGCYHGHSDSLLVKAGSGLAQFSQPSSAGVPPETTQHTWVVPYNDPQALTALFKEKGDSIAAVIVEPLAANMGLVEPAPGFLPLLRHLTQQWGAVLIFDEVMTGFRLAKGGACTTYDVKPDIWTFGKIIGGGLPAAAYGGSKEIMSVVNPLGPAYQAGTLSGNPLAMACGLATLQALEEEDGYAKLEMLGQALDGAVAKVIPPTAAVKYVRKGSFFCFFYGTHKAPTNYTEVSQTSMDTFAAVYHKLLEAGIYLGPSGFEVGFLSTAMEKADVECLASTLGRILSHRGSS